ncbi:zinc metallopeptidase [Facklamia sp. 7083-14-GEN3]|uniref:zinc metallopeptidase n=1 Tax=Facklamia sp. 7083-14-GEN3 TaxID=2973478 RepID=UPI00215C271A|nr:zinc metallopeptidase [Facklamia sp. 7083-14-GEN3]MCR8969975.1 zinc metallopeptidase [Facklamia sp. 7083-14-GEN3]
MYPYGFYFDSTYFLILIGMAIVMYAQWKVKSTFAKYSELISERNISGHEAAELILQANQIHDVRVERVAGNLTDHYSPKEKVLRLSEATYSNSSVAAVAVAAHECGHAVQDAKNYQFLKLRSALVPVSQFGSMIGMPIIIMGFLFQMMGLVTIGILALSAALLFQIVTLPVEIDASKRALVSLEQLDIFTQGEMPAARKVLNAAAFTYIAATLSTALQILRLIILSNRSRRN